MADKGNAVSTGKPERLTIHFGVDLDAKLFLHLTVNVMTGLTIK